MVKPIRVSQYDSTLDNLANKLVNRMTITANTKVLKNSDG